MITNPFSFDIVADDWDMRERLSETTAPHIERITKALAVYGLEYDFTKLMIVAQDRRGHYRLEYEP